MTDHENEHYNLIEDVENDPSAMPLLDHLEDLRRTLMKCGLALFISCAIVFIFFKPFKEMLDWPMMSAIGERPNAGLAVKSPLSVFIIIIQIGILGGFGIALPFIIYFIAQFISPGLTVSEKKYLIPCCIASALLFLLGSLFSYGLLMPLTLHTSVALTDWMGNMQILWEPEKYYSTLIVMVFGVGLVFEFPLLIIGMVAAGLINTYQLKNFRPYSVIVILVISAVIVPTSDPLTFMVMAIPMYILYEGSIIISARIERKIRERELEEEE